MRRYTLNERGRTIFIETPIVAIAVLFTCTNALETLVRWMLGY
jgi:hypothetical protein